MTTNRTIPIICYIVALFWSTHAIAQDDHGFSVEVRAEEGVYEVIPPDNGSGPLWSYGCSPIARVGDEVIISQMETGVDAPKLSNTRWRLLRRTDSGWDCFAEAEDYLQREPTVLATLSSNQVFLNVNDFIDSPGVWYGRTEPKLLRFNLNEVDEVDDPPSVMLPEWNIAGHFTDHSYRGFAADRDQDQLLMLNIDARTSIQHWCLLNADGQTLRNGQIAFPLRGTYPQAALVGGAAHILAISNRVEPVQEWREYKFEQTGREWDYVFRVLYYASSSKIAERDFGDPIEIANVESTGGQILNHDLWIAPDGAAYILYSESEVASELLRDRFFPGKSVIPALHLAIVQDNTIVERRVLAQGDEASRPGAARFHRTPSGNVYALVYMSGAQAANWLMRVYPLADDPPMIPVPFQSPFTNFLLANERAGNAPSFTMDIVGHQRSGATIHYGQVVIHESAR